MKYRDLVVIIIYANVIVIGFAISIFIADGHFFQRAGALLASLAVIFIIWEYNIEKEVDLDPIERTIVDDSKIEIWMLRANLEIKIRNFRITYAKKMRENELENMVRTNAIFGAAGELIHGFGDLMLVAIIKH